MWQQLITDYGWEGVNTVEKYESLEMEVIEFEVEDFITTTVEGDINLPEVS